MYMSRLEYIVFWAIRFRSSLREKDISHKYNTIASTLFRGAQLFRKRYPKIDHPFKATVQMAFSPEDFLKENIFIDCRAILFCYESAKRWRPCFSEYEGYEAQGISRIQLVCQRSFSGNVCRIYGRWKTSGHVSIQMKALDEHILTAPFMLLLEEVRFLVFIFFLGGGSEFAILFFFFCSKFRYGKTCQ